jgi:hypothetical protein
MTTALRLVLAGGALLLIGLALLAVPAAPPAGVAIERHIAAAGADEVVCGVTSLGQWGKSYESWDAGGADYYIMVMDPHYAAAHPQFGEGRLILRPSPPDHIADLSSLVGKHGCVRGALREATPYTPQHAWEQYPVDGHGKPLARGSGMVVHKLSQRLADAAALALV